MDRETRIERLLHYLLDSGVVVGPVREEVEWLLKSAPELESDEQFLRRIKVSLA